MAPALVVPRDLRVGEEAAIVLGFGLSTLAITMRLWTKARLTRKVLLEDYFSLCAYLSFLVYTALAIVIGTNGGDSLHKAYVCPTAPYVLVNVVGKSPLLTWYARCRSSFPKWNPPFTVR